MNGTDTLERPKLAKPAKLTIAAIGLLVFVIAGLLSWTISSYQLQDAELAILNQHEDAQQTWLDKSIHAIRSWNTELENQARYVSTAEMFRLFVLDVKNLSLSDRDALIEGMLPNSNALNREMNERLTYLQDMLADLTKRRMWSSARIMLPDGKILAEPDYSVSLTDSQRRLARQAAKKGSIVYGPVHMSEKGIVMDMADPMYDLNLQNPEVIAILFLTVPMVKPLTTFLTRSGEQSETFFPRIVETEDNELNMILYSAGNIRVQPVKTQIDLKTLAFGRRAALDGKGEVYSMGAMPANLNWLFVLETPAAEIDSLVQSQKKLIYGRGIFASIGIALLCAWLYAYRTSRKYKQEAEKFEKLYLDIRTKKLMLDSINACFQFGLVLVDSFGRVQMFNPGFTNLSPSPQDLRIGMPLVEALPDKAALRLLEDMNKLDVDSKDSSDEIYIKQGNEDRLFRVSIFPYSDINDEQGRVGGWVAVFKDITEYRRKAEEDRKKAEQERKRQAALISALVRAIESVDPALLGQ